MNDFFDCPLSIGDMVAFPSTKLGHPHQEFLTKGVISEYLPDEKLLLIFYTKGGVLSKAEVAAKMVVKKNWP